jgi:hypothetical protein
MQVMILITFMVAKRELRDKSEVPKRELGKQGERDFLFVILNEVKDLELMGG